MENREKDFIEVQAKLYIRETKFGREIWLKEDRTDGKWLRLWTLGLGIPVLLKVTTPEEDAEQEKKEKFNIQQEAKKYRERKQKEKKQPWFKRVFNI